MKEYIKILIRRDGEAAAETIAKVMKQYSEFLTGEKLHNFDELWEYFVDENNRD